MIQGKRTEEYMMTQRQKARRKYHEKIKDDPIERARLSINAERWRRENPAKGMFGRARRRNRDSGIEFTITLEDVVVPEYCPLLKVKLSTDPGSMQFAPSLDRIDNTKGYITGNVQVISLLANRMKNEATLEQIDTFCKNWQEFRK